MRAQRFTRYGILAGVLGALACGGNSARTDDTTVAQDTTTVQDPSAYVAPTRDTTMTGMADSAQANQTKSGVSEIKPGETTDTLPAASDTTAQ